MSRGHELLVRCMLRITFSSNAFWRRGRRRSWPRDRGDVPGWVLVTLMTAGLVITLWAVASPRLEEVFNDAIDTVVGGP